MMTALARTIRLVAGLLAGVAGAAAGILIARLVADGASIAVGVLGFLGLQAGLALGGWLLLRLWPEPAPREQQHEGGPRSE